MRPAAADRHVRAFDGLRGIAIVLVLLRHLGEDLPARRLGGVVDAALNAGWLGVDVFFVLSGFLITGILLDARGDEAQPTEGYFLRFYARRALRIFPLYYLFLAVTIFIARPPMPHGTWWYWTYTSNVLIARHGWPEGLWETGHLWSLAVEEQFYLVWPAIIAWMPRRRLPVLCVAVIVTHRLDHRLTVGGLVVGSLATTLLTAACIGRIETTAWLRRVLEWTPLVSFGTYSYAIYLVQLPLRGGIDYWLGPRRAAWPAMLGLGAEAILLAGGSWCIAWASWRLIERPILSLKRYVPMPQPTLTERSETRLPPLLAES